MLTPLNWYVNLISASKDGEHLFPGQLGHFLVITSVFASLLATFFFYKAAADKSLIQSHWLRYARASFFVQFAALIAVFCIILFICSNHYYEYMYAYKHASRELEPKYLLACIWEGQEGSFLLWAIWHGVLGIIVIARGETWRAPVMSVICLAQFFLLFMLLGVYFGEAHIGNSPFTLTRNELQAPIFSRPNYLSFIHDGMGLNVLLRNYWMVIHPPVLFLGFASAIIPFAFAYAGLRLKKFSDWVAPAMPWALFSACVLGTGIMMGGKWAYESLSFGGYWAWDPVENASLVPWLLLIAAIHTMLVYKATGHSLRATYLLTILSFVFVLYSTFLTRTGILGDTSVHSFTEAGSIINIMIGLFVLGFTLPALWLFGKYYKRIPAIRREEETSSREFWMFIGALVFFLSALFIISITSIPVYNKIPGIKNLIVNINGGSLALPEDPEFLYNKVMVMSAIIVGLLTACAQYLKYKQTSTRYFLRKMGIPFLIAGGLTTVLFIFYPVQFDKHGPGFLVAIYIALFAALFAVVANAMYIWIGLHGKIRHAGGSIAHLGFTLMLAGMLISSSNKQVISSSMVNGILMPPAIDPLTKKQDDPKDNLTLLRQVPTQMGAYNVTYTGDSSGLEKGRRFYNLEFGDKSNSRESFRLQPDVYMMKDNNMSSNPDTKSFFDKDVFTYISYALSEEGLKDTAQFRISEMAAGDTTFYSNGILILNEVLKNPAGSKINLKDSDVVLMAALTVVSKDEMHYHPKPLLLVDEIGIMHTDDTIYAQNLFVRFAGVADNQKIKIGVKESGKSIDYVTVKAYIFPYINLVWAGIIIMGLGIFMSMLKRLSLSPAVSTALLLLFSTGIIYMFLLAN